MPAHSLDYRTAFELAPIGLILSERRQIVDCNARVLEIFGAQREQLVKQSFAVLYPSPAEFERTGERIAARLGSDGHYADDRVMKRLGSQELFWCHVSGQALDTRDPHARGIWSFEDLSSHRQLTVELTPREREIAALLVEGLTSKQIGKRLAVSPRTIDVYRGRLMKKYSAKGTPDLVHRLLRA
ncbi:PAS and helix-turn-helix domain-containing protein [Roseateles paludis]|jgi:PAS domain S-box-containing protein|uniref:PAS and helix-turn-helix domain-containing protein n=1 Tax=Roseateles paludis TaxID=3145238 RepID=A0ABV0G3E9_9BURK